MSSLCFTLLWLCIKFMLMFSSLVFFFFFFNDTATTEIYTLSLHDALPICGRRHCHGYAQVLQVAGESARAAGQGNGQDRKSTRLNSSHQIISYAVFCLKKKKKITQLITVRPDKTH